ncbi:MAG TPA: hypothetical protein VK694_07920 [Verrucomicrobiae bacterium]|nr:hypothetical protein [Verrucomicrobiae bacterium]
MAYTDSPQEMKKISSIKEECFELLEQYRCGRRDPYVTFLLLEEKRVVGAYFAGEFALELAGTVPMPEAEEWVDKAEHKLQPRNFNKQSRDLNVYSSFAARAAVRRAQLPLHRHMLTTQTLPPLDLVEETYMRTLEDSKQVTEVLRAKVGSAPEIGRQALVGLLGEVSVLLLGQRAAKTIGTHEWFPLQSTLFEDNANRFQGPGHGWDVSFFTHMSVEDPIDLAYKVQVKTRDGPYGGEKDEPGIARLNITPDLVVDKREQPHLLAAVIIEECYLEATYPEAAVQRVMPSLGKRTGRLLDKIEQ